MSDDITDNSEVEIALGKTGIFIQDNQLIKKEKDGTTTAKYALLSIKRVSFKQTIDPLAFVFLVTAAASIYFPSMYITAELLKWFFYVVAVILFAFFITGFKRNLVVVELEIDTVVYPCLEEHAVVKGFVVSLQEMLRNKEA
jgi:hypothetical protein